MRSALVLLLAILGAIGIAQVKPVAKVAAADFVGKWDGRFEINLLKIEKSKSTQEIERMKELVRTQRYRFEFKKDGSYSVLTTAGARKGNVSKGKWRIDGRDLVMKDTEKAGKPVPNSQQSEQRLKVIQMGSTIRLAVPKSPAPTYVLLTKAK